ncbi:MAG: hypothetical protein LW630_00910 [Saprospiraceae bacterium]|nr:hypothetical protein [Saprospiraceae bacterium]
MIQMYTEESLINFLNNPSGFFERLEFEFSLNEDSRMTDISHSFSEISTPDEECLLSPSNSVIDRILEYSRTI